MQATQATLNNIYFTPYRVSTITCNADIGPNINLDLAILFSNIEINEIDNSFIWIQYLKDDAENSRGVYPKRRRRTKPSVANTSTTVTKKSRFDNQITVIFKFSSDYMPNVKIFKNGNIQLTGIKNIEDPAVIGNKIIENVIRIYNTVDKHLLLTDYNDVNPISRLVYENFKIRMINTDFKIYQDIEHINRFNIKRKELHNILISQKYNNKSSFQPGIYQGVKLEYFWNTIHPNKNGICTCTNNCFGKSTGSGNGNCKKVTVAIFESGSILITGGITFEQVDDAYEYICGVIKENKITIKKQSAVELSV
jgi:TATA-box binding protein (TBP) (component of TFIID and TFIIIB)